MTNSMKFYVLDPDALNRIYFASSLIEAMELAIWINQRSPIHVAPFLFDEHGDLIAKLERGFGSEEFHWQHV